MATTDAGGVRRRALRLTRDGAVIFVTVVALAVLANLAAYGYAAYEDAQRPSPARHFVLPHEAIEADPAFMRARYPGLEDEEIRARISVPHVVAHPVLEFMERPVRSEAYNVGFENMRHTGRVGEHNAAQVLEDAVWVLGGSTAFGHGVADDETVVHYLDVLDDEARYVNFGVQGYHQSLEIEKLLLLLKKGYRPRRVVFLDGLNDMLAMLGHDFAPEESPMVAFSAYAYTYNVHAFHRQKGLQDLLLELPLGKLLDQWRARRDAKPVTIADGFEPIYEPESQYVTHPRRHYLATPPAYDGKREHLEAYVDKLGRYYRSNLALIAGLARGFDLDVQVFFQPIGLLQADNPFIRDFAAYRDSDVHVLLSTLREGVRAGIEAKDLAPMIDLSTADRACSDCYVDLAHYSPQLNRQLAEAILAHRVRTSTQSAGDDQALPNR